MGEPLSPNCRLPAGPLCWVCALQYCQWAVASVVMQCKSFWKTLREVQADSGKEWVVWLWVGAIFFLVYLTSATVTVHSPLFTWPNLYLNLMNNAGLILMTPWDPTPPQMSVGTWWVVDDLGVPWTYYWVASDPALVLRLKLYQSGEYYLHLPKWLTENVLQTTHIPPEVLTVTKPNRQLVVKHRCQKTLGILINCPRACCWKTPDLVCSLTSPPHTQAQQRQPQKCGSLYRSK